MPTQHITGEEANQEQGIVVPLEWAGLRILKQEVQTDGRIRVEVIGTNERATCPHGGAVCVKQHDVRSAPVQNFLSVARETAIHLTW